MGIAPLQPNKDYDTCIEQLMKSRDQFNMCLFRGIRSRLHKELLIASITEHMGHGNSVTPGWWTPSGRSRLAKREADSSQPTVQQRAIPELYSLNDLAKLIALHSQLASDSQLALTRSYHCRCLQGQKGHAL